MLRIFFAPVLLMWSANLVVAQDIPTGILAPGNAVVTGFSGAILPAQITAGTVPADKTFIDLDGPSARIIDLQIMNGYQRAQLIKALKPYTVTATQIGQGFAVALDNAVPPNIYIAATSAYGLPIVVPGPDGQPLHTKLGAPNATFMSGLFGPAPGGPGSIWKIDGVTAAVSLFANVTLNGVPNSGPALGGLVFDPGSNSLLVADRETGMIHRFGMNGAEIGLFDHGVQGRQAAGLPPVPFDAKKRLDIHSPHFDSTNPATWAYAPPERLIFGLGIRAGRLYYAVAAGLHIWSVGLDPGGSFRNDATIEIEVPPAAGPTEISKITFDDDGRMFLAERPAPIGAYDFEALTPEGIGRVLRYAIVDSYPGAQRVWQPAPDEYAIGFALQLKNDNGGVAIGYNYDANGVLDRSSCGGFLWSTGEQLRKSVDPKLTERLNQTGPPNVDGLQGNLIGLIRPMNVPPERAYFIDYDDRFDDDAARGHLGDIAIWRVCGPVLRGGWMQPGWMLGQWWGSRPGTSPPPPSRDCPSDQKKPGFQCCPKGTSLDASGQCKPWCPNGAMDAQSQQFCGLGFDPTTLDLSDPSKLQCIGGGKPDPAKNIFGCVQNSPIFNASVCPAGWSKQNISKVGTICAPTQQQLQCGPGQQVSNIDNRCHKLCLGTAWPVSQCCASGSVVSSTGRCCPLGSTPDPTTGQCKPSETCLPNSKSCTPSPPCPPSQVNKQDHTCCPSGQVPNDVIGGCCPAGQTPAADTGICKSIACTSPNKMINDRCCSPNDLEPGGMCSTCVPGKTPVGASNYCCDTDKAYIDPNGAKSCCLTGKVIQGVCCPSSQMTRTGICCPQGQTPGGPNNSQCLTPPTDGMIPTLPGCSAGSMDPLCCSNGYAPTADGYCCQSGQLTTTGTCCPQGQKPGGPNNNQCQPSTEGQPPGRRSRTQGPQCCADGSIPEADGACCKRERLSRSGVCCSAWQIPDPSGRQDCVGGPVQRIPIPSCSLERGQITTADGNCCQINSLTSNGKCCADGTVVSNDGTSCVAPPGPNRSSVAPPCGPNLVRGRFGNCVPLIQGEPDKPMLLPQTPPNPCDGPNMVRDRSGSCVPLLKDGGSISTQTPSKPCGPNKVRGRNGRCVPLTKAGTHTRGDTDIGHAKRRTRTKAEIKNNGANINIDHAIGGAIIQNIFRGATKGRGAPSVPLIKTPSGNNPINPNNPGVGR